MKTFNNDVQIINLLLATDKYLIHLRKLKNAKTEAIKISLATATAKDRKSPDEQSKANQKSAKSIAKVDKNNEAKTKKNSSQAQASSDDQTQKDSQKETEDNIEIPPCKNIYKA